MRPRRPPWAQLVAALVATATIGWIAPDPASEPEKNRKPVFPDARADQKKREKRLRKIDEETCQSRFGKRRRIAGAEPNTVPLG